jgi:hypothetical protein
MSMPSTARATDNEAKLADIEHGLRVVREHLRAMKQRLDEEIREYPTPIPRCDAQFNHLFEQRARLNQALERLDSPTTRDGAESIALLDEFVRSPAYLDEPAEAALRTRIGAELSRFAS